MELVVDAHTEASQGLAFRHGAAAMLTQLVVLQLLHVLPQVIYQIFCVLALELLFAKGVSCCKTGHKSEAHYQGEFCPVELFSHEYVAASQLEVFHEVVGVVLWHLWI